MVRTINILRSILFIVVLNYELCLYSCLKRSSIPSEESLLLLKVLKRLCYRLEAYFKGILSSGGMGRMYVTSINRTI